MMENIHQYIYNDRDEQVFINTPLSSESRDLIRLRFQRQCTQAPHLVFTDEGIRRVLDIKQRTFANRAIVYNEYTVERAAGRITVFNDNDLINLNPWDLVDLFRYVDGKAERGIKFNVARGNLINTMGRLVRFRAKNDFQIALETGVERLSCTAPNQDLEGINEFRNYSVVTEPELGFIYRDEYEVKKYFRVTEAFKYSSETLHCIRSAINERLGKTNVPEVQGKEIIFNITTVLNYRDLMMRFWRLSIGESTVV